MLVLPKSQRHLSHNQTKTSPMLIIILTYISPFSEAGSPHIAHFGLDLMSLLPQLSECWVSFPTVLIQVTNSFQLTGERRVSSSVESVPSVWEVRSAETLRQATGRCFSSLWFSLQFSQYPARFCYWINEDLPECRIAENRWVGTVK